MEDGWLLLCGGKYKGVWGEGGGVKV